MLKRICIALVETEAFSEGHLVIAWPWSNNPSHLTSELLALVSAAVGGLPVVLMASSPDGLHTFGCPDGTREMAGIDLRSVDWTVLDLDDGRPTTSGSRGLAA